MTEERLALSELLEKAGDGDFLLDRPSTRPRCLGAWVMVASFGDRIRPKLGAASATGAGRRRPTTSPICSPGCAADSDRGFIGSGSCWAFWMAPVELCRPKKILTSSGGLVAARQAAIRFHAETDARPSRVAVLDRRIAALNQSIGFPFRIRC